MSAFFSPDTFPFVKYVLILAATLCLVGVFYVVLRKMTGGKLISSEAENSRGRQPRLGVIDVYDLDRTRQLVLLRRDNVEHLLLIGGPNDVVVESNIVRVTSGKVNVAAEISYDRPAFAVESVTRSLSDQQSRPVVESGVFRTGGEEQSPYVHIPAQPGELPQTPVISPQGGASAQQATVAAASFAAVAAATQYGHEVAEHGQVDVPDFLREPHASRQPHHPPVAEPHQPAEVAPAVEAPVWEHRAAPAGYGAYEAPPFAQEPQIGPEAKPDTVTIADYHALQHAESDETKDSKYDFTFGGLTDPIGNYAQALPPEDIVDRQEPVFQSEPVFQTPSEPEPPVEEPEAPQPAAATGEPPLQLDETAFSDMARQLEEALKGAIPDIPPVEATETVQPPPLPEIEAEAHLHADIERKMDEIAQAVMAPMAEKPSFHGPETEREKEIPAEAQWQEPAAPASPSGQKAPDEDPFSLDDIEAEFARLLGRSEDKSGKS